MRNRRASGFPEAVQLRKGGSKRCGLKKYWVAIVFVICGVVLLSLSPSRGQSAIRLLGLGEMRETVRGAIPFPCDGRYSWWCDDTDAYCTLLGINRPFCP